MPLAEIRLTARRFHAPIDLQEVLALGVALSPSRSPGFATGARSIDAVAVILLAAIPAD